MTRDQVVDLILQRCVRRASDADLVSHIVLELNLAQQQTFERGTVKPWFLLNVAEIEVDATGFRAPLPEDFLDLFEEEPAILVVTTSGGLKMLDRADRSAVEASLRPVNTLTSYDIMEGYVLLAKALDAGTVLRMLYYQAEPLPVGDYAATTQPGPNRWYTYASDLMIGEVGAIIAGTRLRDEKIQARLESLRTQAWNRLLAETVAKSESSKIRFLNGSLYPVVGPTRTLTPSGNVSDPVGFTTRTYNTAFVKGDTWTRQITYSIDGTPVDLTGYTAILTVKATYAGAALITLTSTPAAGLTLNYGGDDGVILMTIDATDSDTLDAGTYVYDLELTTGSTVATIMRGTMTVEPEVT